MPCAHSRDATCCVPTVWTFFVNGHSWRWAYAIRPYGVHSPFGVCLPFPAPCCRGVSHTPNDMNASFQSLMPGLLRGILAQKRSADFWDYKD